MGLGPGEQRTSPTPAAGGAGSTAAAPVPLVRIPPAAIIALAFVVPPVLVGAHFLFAVKVTQLLIIAPCIAAGAARPRAVAVNTLYVLLLMTALAKSPPNPSWGTSQQAFTTGVGLAVGVVCVALATRQRRLTRLAARTEGRRTILAGIVESADEAIVACLLDGTVTLWNRGAEKMFGYSAAEAVGMSVGPLYPPEAVSELIQLRERISAGENVTQHETLRVHRDGHLIDVSATMSPIRGVDTTIIGAAVLTRDIGPLRRAEHERARFEQRLQRLQRVESLSRMAGGVAHDFNNLLAVIISSSEFIDEGAEDPVGVRADNAAIRRAADRAAVLTRHLLRFARGAGSVSPRAVDVGALTRDCAERIKVLVGDDVEVRTVAGAGTAVVHMDEEQLREVLFSLVTNAREAMTAGGTLTVTTEVVHPSDGTDSGDVSTSAGFPHVPDSRDPGAETSGSPAGPRVLLSVSDTGSGMSPEVADKVFEPFFSTKPRSAGGGLGLASAYGIVTDAGGSLDVRSAVGEGTTVCVDLPLAGADVHPVTPAGRDPAPAGARRCVLVAEDEGELRDLVVRMLEAGGYRVIGARTGTEGLRLGLAEPIDILLSDVIMPDISGPDLAAALLDHRPDLPVLFMSGYSDGALHLETGVDLLTKPFTQRQLLGRVGAALDQRVQAHIGG